MIEAIQAKLQGPARDPEFLRNLIYSGAVNIVIDGLNEVSADIRAKITEFVESYFQGNIIMASQPLEWIPPATARIYHLQPLSRDQIERFLLTREPTFREELSQSRVDYQTACLTYLRSDLDGESASEASRITLRVLSNPMDLSTVAQLLCAANDLISMPCRNNSARSWRQTMKQSICVPFRSRNFRKPFTNCGWPVRRSCRPRNT